MNFWLFKLRKFFLWSFKCKLFSEIPAIDFPLILHWISIASWIFLFFSAKINIFFGSFSFLNSITFPSVFGRFFSLIIGPILFKKILFVNFVFLSNAILNSSFVFGYSKTFGLYKFGAGFSLIISIDLSDFANDFFSCKIWFIFSLKSDSKKSLKTGSKRLKKNESKL